MEKLNATQTPAKLENEILTPSDKINAEVGVDTDVVVKNTSSAEESESETPRKKIIKLREQKTTATEQLHSEFWPDELEDAREQASAQTIKNILTKAQDSKLEESTKDVPLRVKSAMEAEGQIRGIDYEINRTYDENPDLVESRIKEILSSHFTPDRLAAAQSEGLLWRYHDSFRNTIPLYNKEFQSLLTKFEKHQGYDRSRDIDTPETQSPQYNFVEGFVSQLTQERADEIALYEALSPEEKERYLDRLTVREQLSYQDADLPPAQLEAMLRDAEGRETAEQYAHHLNQLDKETEWAVPRIKGQTKKVLDTLGIPISPYGNSDSWAYWDLGKQQYYYEQNKYAEPKEDNPYTYAPAIEKLDEISDRHVGWEFYHASREVREQALKAIEDSHYLAKAFNVLQNDPKADGQLASHEYAELGKVLREYARNKDR